MKIYTYQKKHAPKAKRVSFIGHESVDSWQTMSVLSNNNTSKTRIINWTGTVIIDRYIVRLKWEPNRAHKIFKRSKKSNCPKNTVIKRRTRWYQSVYFFFFFRMALPFFEKLRKTLSYKVKKLWNGDHIHTNVVLEKRNGKIPYDQ